MKTIFRYTNTAFLMAAMIALGAVAGLAQTPTPIPPCEDAAGQTELGDKFRAQYPAKDIPGRKTAIETGKQFLEKYGACESAKDLSDYLKARLPKMEELLKAAIEKEYKDKLLARFDTGLTSKNWDEVYAAGKEILQKYPDEFRTAELVLGSIGLDETAKTPRVTKWNEDTLKFAKISIADLEGGKTFTSFGVKPFTYKNKEDALGWMNYTIGYIYYFDKNSKKDGLSYLYKATQLASDTKTNPIVFQSIGSFYFDEVRKLALEVDALAKTQNDKDPEDVAKQKVEAIKAKVAMVNGTAEAAFDAYARAYNLAKADPKSPKAYNDSLFKTLQDLYNVRFGKPDGFDAFLTNTVKKPLPNPLNPVAPISDPEPSSTTTTTTTPATTPATTTVKAPVTTPAKPATTPATGTKPATTTTAKPIPPAKPQAVVKKPAVKKKGA